jgi:hypothetical protein
MFIVTATLPPEPTLKLPPLIMAGWLAVLLAHQHS